jgi:hypothetical protein
LREVVERAQRVVRRELCDEDLRRLLILQGVPVAAEELEHPHGVSYAHGRARLRTAHDQTTPLR